MPPLDGATAWISIRVHAGLRGQVVLVDFWTLTIINWAAHEPYAGVGVATATTGGSSSASTHRSSPSSTRSTSYARRTTQRGIDYPVAVDNDYAIWQGLRQPLRAVLRDHHFGEGRDEQSERVIQQSLGVERGARLRRKGSAWRRRPTGHTCVRPRTISATGGASTSRHRRRRVRRTPRLRASRAPALRPSSTSGRSTVRTSNSGSPEGASPTGSMRATAISCSLPGRTPLPRSSTAGRRAGAQPSTRTGTARPGGPPLPARAGRTAPRAHTGDHVPRARAPGSRNVISSVRSRTASCARTSW